MVPLQPNLIGDPPVLNGPEMQMGPEPVLVSQDALLMPVHGIITDRSLDLIYFLS